MPNLLDSQQFPSSLYGYNIRPPFDTEHKYFRSNTHVAGMAAEDGHIVLNPYSTLSTTEMLSVAKNEAARLFIRQNKVPIGFSLTPQQIQSFKGTTYEKDPEAMKATVAARLLTGDPSAGISTPGQDSFVRWLSTELGKRNKQ